VHSRLVLSIPVEDVDSKFHSRVTCTARSAVADLCTPIQLSNCSCNSLLVLLNMCYLARGVRINRSSRSRYLYLCTLGQGMSLLITYDTYPWLKNPSFPSPHSVTQLLSKSAIMVDRLPVRWTLLPLLSFLFCYMEASLAQDFSLQTFALESSFAEIAEVAEDDFTCSRSKSCEIGCCGSLWVIAK
jgi:hypothetical protein